jgi:hypothetical protein
VLEVLAVALMLMPVTVGVRVALVAEAVRVAITPEAEAVPAAVVRGEEVAEGKKEGVWPPTPPRERRRRRRKIWPQLPLRACTLVTAKPMAMAPGLLIMPERSRAYATLKEFLQQSLRTNKSTSFRVSCKLILVFRPRTPQVRCSSCACL